MEEVLTLDKEVLKCWQETQRLPKKLLADPDRAGEVIDAISDYIFECNPDLLETLQALERT